MFRTHLACENLTILSRAFVALRGGECKPLESLNVIPQNTLTIAIARAEVVLGEHVPLFCGLAIKLDCLLVINGNTFALVVDNTEIILG